MSAHRTNRILIGAAAAVGVLAGAAGLSAAVTGEGGSDPAPALAREEAEATAVEEVPGTVVGVEAEDEGGRAVWSVEVEGADGRRHEVDVDDHGAVVGRDTEDGTEEDGTDDDGTDDEVSDPALVAQATVTQAEAEGIARAEVPGTVRSIHVEQEDGGLQWDVEVTATDGTRHDLQVDADTGAVVEHDTDD